MGGLQGGDGRGFGGREAGSRVLVAAADLEPSGIQDLADAVPRLLELKARSDLDLRFRVRIELGDGQDSPDENVVRQVNEVLGEVDAGLRLE